MEIQTISPTELATLQAANPRLDLLDVCTPAEFAGLHAAGARSVPLDQLDPAREAAAHADGAALYLFCQSGRRAEIAARALAAGGVKNLAVVDGGARAWAALGLPVVRGQKTISLERQVRIAAGALVLCGLLLGALASPVFYLLPGFVGAGLLFAGITDTCGMGLLLARMPWNRCARVIDRVPSV